MSRSRPVRPLAVLVTFVLTAACTIAGAASVSAATQTCNKYGTATVSGGRYIVMNNEWGDDVPQCINITDDGFTITTANHSKPTNGSPASYPAIYAGCHYRNCSSGTGLPLQVAKFGSPRTSVDFTTTSNGQWDAAYDIWFDPTSNPTGHNSGAELMIWGNHRGSPQPAGSKTGTATLAGATWDVWRGGIVVSYVRQSPTNSLSNLNIKDFTDDAAKRGYIQSSWYLTSVQFGFEPWQGGAGLGVNSFSFTP